MDQPTYDAYIRRAHQAESVRELRALADEVRSEFPLAVETEQIRDACQRRAIAMLALPPRAFRQGRLARAS